jgi:HK97 gp10 family phage protein
MGPEPLSYNPTAARFKRDMQNLTNTLAKNIHDAYSMQADEVIENMQARVPVESGHLRNSIRKRDVSTESKPSFLILAGGKETTHMVGGHAYDYALAIEFGTQRNPPEPFFYVTYRQYVARGTSWLQETVDQTIEENNRVRGLRSENYDNRSFMASRGYRGATTIHKSFGFFQT